LHHVRVYSNALHLNHNDRLTLLANFGFDAAVMDIFAALLNGACLYPLRIRDEEYTGELLDRMGEQQLTVLHATPTVFRHLMRNKVCRHDLGCIRMVVLGGEETTAEDFALFRRQFAPPTLFVNGLGPSESTLALQFFADHGTRLPGHAVPVGLPVDGMNVELINADGSEAGIYGELVLCSAYVSTGYWQQPELTAERFIADSDEPGVFRYHTGDRARYLPDGRLVFMGRVDDQVKVRGHRIEPGEVETALMGIAGVERCAVVLREERLVAYVVGQIDPSTLRSALSTVLPDYMVPGAFVQLDELPLTPNGKLDRKALPQPATMRDESAEYVAPRNEIEVQLVRIWAEVLGLTEQGEGEMPLGVHDDFFALGGHSLLAAQLVARITDSMRVGLPIRRLFDTPTVAGIAEHVETLRWALGTDEPAGS
jgi:acyl-coenzyme A synthetase/AMP-(fatty) acid ligase